MILLTALIVAAALGLLTFALLAQAQDRAVVSDSLRKLDGYELINNLREDAMLDPFGSRVFAPVLRGALKLGMRFTPMGYMDKMRRKLVLAGKPDPENWERFLAIRVLSLLGVPLSFGLAFAMGGGGTSSFLVFVLLVAIFVLGPDVYIARAITSRQYQIRMKLPDILDLLTVSVEAGLGLDQAIDRTVDTVPGPLSDEFARMLNETRAGATRADAMRAMEQRTDVAEVRSFVMAILQADTFGVSIGRVLRTQADEMRIKRRQLAQERAQKVPVKMLIPMVFCIFPALFVVVIGPAIINIMNNFK